MNTIIVDNPDPFIKLWAIKSCDIIQYNDYSDLFARLSLRGSIVITLLRNNSYSIHPAYQLGVVSRVICLSTIKTFIKQVIPPYMIDDSAIIFPETNEIMLLNQIERNSNELKKAIKQVVLLPSGIVHALPEHSSIGKH